MDKRSFLAILITFAILIGWQMIYVRPKQQEAARIRTEQARADSIEAAMAPDTADAGAQAEVYMPEPAAESPVVEESGTKAGIFSDTGEVFGITVDTGPMIVSLTSLGGEISGVELTGYERFGGGNVQLVPEGSSGGASLGVEKDGRWIGLSGVRFSAAVNGREAMAGERVVLGEGEEEATVVFRREAEGGALIEKKFAFRRGSYETALSVTIGREGELRDTGSYSVSWTCGLARSEKDEKQEVRQFASMGRVGEDIHVEPVRKFGKTDLKEEKGVVVWAGARTKYFLSAILTGTQRTGTLGMLGDKDISQVGWSVTYPFSGDPRMVRDDYVIYTGPQDMQALKEYGVGLEKTIDLGWMPVLSKPALQLLIWMYSLIPNYGVVIIILSVLTKILFYRLSHKSFRSMKDMQRLQPRLKALQEKYKDDRNRLNQETMKLYKEAGVNPLGGCLPMLLQMPVFIALFGALRFTIELRHAPFMLWIQDLSSPDVLFDFGVKLPMLGSEFHLLPLMMGAGMFLQSKLSGGSPTGEAATGTASQQKMMQWMMPIVFTVLFYNMPSGLVLYWFINQVFSAVQQYWVHRQIEAEDAVATQEA